MIGYDWTFLPSWTVGARLIGRRLNDAVEDVSLDLGAHVHHREPRRPLSLLRRSAEPGPVEPGLRPHLDRRVGTAGIGADLRLQRRHDLHRDVSAG